MFHMTQKVKAESRSVPGKCAMSDWAEWSECSVTCGVGQRFRKRMYLINDMDETMCGQPTMESENCIGMCGGSDLGSNLGLGSMGIKKSKSILAYVI